MSKILLLDGDWITYTAGFAGESKRYVVPGLYGDTEFNTIAEIKAEEGDETQFHVYHRVEVSPVEWVLHTTKSMIANAVEAVSGKIGGVPELQILLDGDGNFRNKIATIRPYKGNRVSAKPTHYHAIVKYMKENYDVQVVDGQEVDDEMAIRATADRSNTIMCAVDKDMLQVPGYHYNPNKGFRKVSVAQGNLALYRQALSGDSTDNIAGAYRIGAKQAAEIITPGMSEELMWQTVVKHYEITRNKFGDDVYNGLDGHEAAIENMRLVYLRRRPDELWTPSGG